MKRLIFVLLALSLTACPPPRRVAISNLSDVTIEIVTESQVLAQIEAQQTIIAGDSKEVSYNELGYGGEPGARTFVMRLRRNKCVAETGVPASNISEDFYRFPGHGIALWLVIDDDVIYLARPSEWTDIASVDYSVIGQQETEQPEGFPVQIPWSCDVGE